MDFGRDKKLKLIRFSDRSVYITFFCFLTVCLGANAEIAKCLDLARETPKLARKSGHQLERFLLRRANQMVKDQETLNQQYCLLLAYELLYLWNALGACLKHSHAAIQIGKSLMYIRPNKFTYTPYK